MKAYVIRKADDTMSEQFANECISSAKSFGISVEKFDGVYSNHQALLDQYNIKPGAKLKHRAEQPGIQGCFLSHYLLWEKCLELNEPIIILEHDAVFIRPLPDNILDLFTHHCILDDSLYCEGYEDTLSDETVDVKLFLKRKNSKPTWSKMQYVCGSHAHIVKPLGAQTLINNVKKHGWLPADRAVNTNYTEYVTIRPIPVRCHPFFSTKKNRILYSHVTGTLK